MRRPSTFAPSSLAHFPARNGRWGRCPSSARTVAAGIGLVGATLPTAFATGHTDISRSRLGTPIASDHSEDRNAWPKKPLGVEQDPQDDGEETVVDSYYLAPGCGATLERHAGEPPALGFYEVGSKAVGKVQCCSPKAMPSYCVRSVTNECIGGHRRDKLYSWDEAQSICQSRSFRLCTREELQNEDSSGCCDHKDDVCGLDRAFVWTSDHKVQSENANLWEYIRDLRRANEALVAETLVSQKRSRALKATYEHRLNNPDLEAQRVLPFLDPAVAAVDADTEASMRAIDDFDRNFTKVIGAPKLLA